MCVLCFDLYVCVCAFALTAHWFRPSNITNKHQQAACEQATKRTNNNLPVRSVIIAQPKYFLNSINLFCADYSWRFGHHQSSEYAFATKNVHLGGLGVWVAVNCLPVHRYNESAYLFHLFTLENPLWYSLVIAKVIAYKILYIFDLIKISCVGIMSWYAF